MKDFKTKKTMPKKMLAGAATVVALSGFVPAINAASPTANTNVGAEVVIQQAITINVGAPVNFGTMILTNATASGYMVMDPNGLVGLGANLVGEVSLIGGNAKGTMAINSSAGAVNIALGAAPTDDGGNIVYPKLRFGTAIAIFTWISASSNKTLNLIGGVFGIGGQLVMTSKPTPGTYTGKSYTVTVTDI